MTGNTKWSTASHVYKRSVTKDHYFSHSTDIIALAWFNVLWFKTVPAVFTLLTVPVCYICHHFAMNIIMV